MARTKLTPLQWIYGLIRQRQGGTTGAATWLTSGTSNTDLTGTACFIQVGNVATSSAGSVVVTFPVAFNQVPVVVAQSFNNSVFSSTTIESISTTTFSIDTYNTANARITGQATWIAIGQ